MLFINFRLNLLGKLAATQKLNGTLVQRPPQPETFQLQLRAIHARLHQQCATISAVCRPRDQSQTRLKPIAYSDATGQKSPKPARQIPLGRQKIQSNVAAAPGRAAVPAHKFAPRCGDWRRVSETASQQNSVATQRSRILLRTNSLPHILHAIDGSCPYRLKAPLKIRRALMLALGCKFRDYWAGFVRQKRGY